jgi:hypothetical protein
MIGRKNVVCFFKILIMISLDAKRRTEKTLSLSTVRKIGPVGKR